VLEVELAGGVPGEVELDLREEGPTRRGRRAALRGGVDTSTLSKKICREHLFRR
jgi:hypothetical protein